MTDPELDPASFVLLEEFRLTRSVAIQWSVASICSFFAFAYAAGAMLAWLSGGSLEPITVAPDDPVLDVVAVVVLLATVVLAHEAIHGLAMALFGDRPDFGVGVAFLVLPFAYASGDGTSYERNRMLAILLAPLVAITVGGLALALVVPSRLLIVAVAANAAGSVGDCWMAAALLRYPDRVRVAALPDPDAAGMGIYGDPSTDPSASRLFAMLPPFARGTVATFGTIVAVIVAAVLGSLATGSRTVRLGDPETVWFLLRHEVDPDSFVATVEFGVPSIAALCVAGGLASLAYDRYARRS